MNNVLTSLEKKFKVWPPRKTVMVEKIIREVVELVDTDVIDKSISCDANGWPEYFFDKTAGCMAGAPVKRYSQGKYESRFKLR